MDTKELLGGVKEAWENLRNSDAIIGKIPIDELKASRKEVQSQVATFKSALARFFKSYKKSVKNINENVNTVELNRQVRTLLSNSDKDASKIKSDKTMTKEDKAAALKVIAQTKAGGVKLALKALEETYKAFISAVNKNDDQIEQEYKVLIVQTDLFIRQYEALTGYVIDNAPLIALVGGTLCIATASISALGTAAIAKTMATATTSKYWSSVSARLKNVEMAEKIVFNEIQVNPIDVKEIKVNDIVSNNAKVSAAHIADAIKNTSKGQVNASRPITTAQVMKMAKACPSFAKYSNAIDLLGREINIGYSVLTESDKERLVKMLAKQVVFKQTANGIAIAGAATCIASQLKKKKGYQSLSFVHKADILAKVTNDIAMKKKEKKIEKMHSKK